MEGRYEGRGYLQLDEFWNEFARLVRAFKHWEVNDLTHRFEKEKAGELIKGLPDKAVVAALLLAWPLNEELGRYLLGVDEDSLTNHPFSIERKEKLIEEAESLKRRAVMLIAFMSGER